MYRKTFETVMGVMDRLHLEVTTYGQATDETAQDVREALMQCATEHLDAFHASGNIGLVLVDRSVAAIQPYMDPAEKCIPGIAQAVRNHVEIVASKRDWLEEKREQVIHIVQGISVSAKVGEPLVISRPETGPLISTERPSVQQSAELSAPASRSVLPGADAGYSSDAASEESANRTTGSLVQEAPHGPSLDHETDNTPHAVAELREGLPFSYPPTNNVPNAALPNFLFRREGKLWRLIFNGTEAHVTDLLGIGYIAELLRKPRVAIEAGKLRWPTVECLAIADEPGIPLADDDTIKSVRGELAARQDELGRLCESDWPRRGALKEEISELKDYLGQVERRRGQARKVRGTAQKSRTSVTNGIARAIRAISHQHPDLARHLKDSIHTGGSPAYVPKELPNWHF
ncbi:MAG: hypothetical protein HY820_08640 [Acidobacteria bacterium]|nr:hypothetical protein [Acidobacteriota bacterium]